MTLTGSWPTMRPGATGYSPLRICTSVPQIVVIVARTMASVGPQAGIARSCNAMTPGRSNTAARIVPDPSRVAAGCEVGAVVMADLARVVVGACPTLRLAGPAHIGNFARWGAGDYGPEGHEHAPVARGGSSALDAGGAVRRCGRGLRHRVQLPTGTGASTCSASSTSRFA